MGNLKLMHMKESKDSFSGRHLKNAINYVLKKTVNKQFLGGTLPANTEKAFEEMQFVKEQFGKVTNSKKNRRQGYHFVITLLPDEATPEICTEIAQEFCEKFLEPDGFQYLYGTHTDQKHLHTHIIFNSVSMNGKMYYYKNGDWEKMLQPLVNKICKKYGCSEVSIKKVDGEKTKAFEKYQSFNKYNFYNLVRQDIDKAIALSNNIADFYKILEENDYDFGRKGFSKKYNQEYITFIPKFSLTNQKVRSYRLGVGYTLKSIENRIKNKSNDEKVQEALFNISKTDNKRLYVLWKDKPQIVKDQYKKNISLMKKWSNNTFKPFPNSYLVKKDMQRIDKIIEEFNLLQEYNLNSDKDILDRSDYLKDEIVRLSKKRQNLYFRQKKFKETHNNEISKLNSEIRHLRAENRVIDRICEYNSIKSEKSDNYGYFEYKEQNKKI